MRTAFGRFAQELRARRNLSQTEFSVLIEFSVAHVSNLESQRTSMSDDIVSRYISILECDGKEAHQLRKLANFSETLRKTKARDAPHPPLQTLLEAYGDRLSPSALAKIQEIVERETGEQVSALCFSSTESKTRQVRRSNKVSQRPQLTPQRFAEIAVLAGIIRQEYADDMQTLNVGRMLEKLASEDTVFDTRVVENLPHFLDGAFACIIGDVSGHTLIIEEKRLLSAEKGVHFCRHVICHELGHHILHAELLNSDHEVYLAPQELSKNSPELYGSEYQIRQVVNSVEEVEAECFATFLLVPWMAFVKGTSAEYISSDFGEQRKEVDRYFPFFAQNAVRDAFKEVLWKRNMRSHPIFQA